MKARLSKLTKKIDIAKYKGQAIAGGKYNIDQRQPILHGFLEQPVANKESIIKIDQQRIIIQIEYVGFSLTKFWPIDARNESNLHKNFFQELIALNSLEEAKELNLDVVLKPNLNNENDPQFFIDIQKNQTLIEERRKISEEKGNKSIAKNVLLLYIDAVSRQMAERLLPLTMDWLSNKYQKTQNRETLEFFRYHTVVGYTPPNLRQFYFGTEFKVPENWNSSSKAKKSMIQNYKDNGFIVGHTTASCTEMMIDINKTESQYYQHSSPDHSSYAFACDPNYVNPENSYGFENGPNGLIRRCLYKQDYLNYLFNYTYDFWTKYQDEKKFMIVEMNDGHDFSGEVLQYWDQPGSEFIKKMEREGLLEDTVIILLADHGDHMQGLYRFVLQLKDCLSEISLPMFFLNLPTQVLEKQENHQIIENLKQNQQKLVTMNNLHYMMKAIPEGLSYSEIQQSVFADLPPDRDCTAYPIMDSAFCACKNQNEL